MARHPKGQMKEAQSGEGYRGGKQTAPSSGPAPVQNSQSESNTTEGMHTASWQTGSKLTVKRNG